MVGSLGWWLDKGRVFFYHFRGSRPLQIPLWTRPCTTGVDLSGFDCSLSVFSFYLQNIPIVSSLLIIYCLLISRSKSINSFSFNIRLQFGCSRRCILWKWKATRTQRRTTSPSVFTSFLPPATLFILSWLECMLYYLLGFFCWIECCFQQIDEHSLVLSVCRFQVYTAGASSMQATTDTWNCNYPNLRCLFIIFSIAVLHM